MKPGRVFSPDGRQVGRMVMDYSETVNSVDTLTACGFEYRQRHELCLSTQAPHTHSLYLPLTAQMHKQPLKDIQALTAVA